MAVAEQLQQGIAELGLDLDQTRQKTLLAYLDLLDKWNGSFNLTAVRDPEAMVSQHLLDSLSALPHLRGPALLDVGTGAGLPGIPLAIARPDWRFTLLDSNGKKTRFLRQAVLELDLVNITVLQARVEAYRAPEPYPEVICRAYAALPDIIEDCRNLVAPDGRLLAMKGRLPERELSQLPKSFNVQCLPLRVPGLEGERHLVIVTGLTRGEQPSE